MPVDISNNSKILSGYVTDQSKLRLYILLSNGDLVIWDEANSGNNKIAYLPRSIFPFDKSVKSVILPNGELLLIKQDLEKSLTVFIIKEGGNVWRDSSTNINTKSEIRCMMLLNNSFVSMITIDGLLFSYDYVENKWQSKTLKGICSTFVLNNFQHKF